jgi:seryl-tRNA synthetase
MSQQTMRQAAVEHEALRHIITALRTVLEWKPSADDGVRKLSSLRFITQSFQRHLERLMALKEQDGYMTDAVEQMPSLAEKVETLLNEHDQFEEKLHQLVLRLEHVSANDRAKMDADGMAGRMLLKLDDHHCREVE